MLGKEAHRKTAKKAEAAAHIGSKDLQPAGPPLPQLDSPVHAWGI
ncbi:hypothetical protein ACP70R_012105 [Stipagrostis hirtigluma subsp. patula]